MICAYPITPQTHIVEGLRRNGEDGELANCEYINVESEFAAMSVAIGASAAGARTYTATASQGLLFMAEAVYNASGLGLPIVMTIGNRAIGAPINIWNDHSDSMSMRDAGWIQLYAETNQEALDLHIQAFRLAEELSCPVMVCVDGFILTHAYDRVDVPTQAQVDAYLPPFAAAAGTRPAQSGQHRRHGRAGSVHGGALPRAPQAVARARPDPAALRRVQQQFGRASGGLLRTYRTEDAETIVVALGSVNGTIQEVVDEMRTGGSRIGSVSICSFRPFPLGALREALERAKRVVVIEKSLAVGLGGILSDGVRKALSGIVLNGYTVIAGLGGRAITRASLRQLFLDAEADELEQVTFLDLNADLVAHELAREAESRKTGPTAEAILRRIGTVASQIG